MSSLTSPIRRKSHRLAGASTTTSPAPTLPTDASPSSQVNLQALSNHIVSAISQKGSQEREIKKRDVTSDEAKKAAQSLITAALVPEPRSIPAPTLQNFFNAIDGVLVDARSRF